MQKVIKNILTSRVYEVAIETPLEEASALSDQLGNRIRLKREDKQPVFSFKLRGAYNRMAHLDPDEAKALCTLIQQEYKKVGVYA